MDNAIPIVVVMVIAMGLWWLTRPKSRGTYRRHSHTTRNLQAQPTAHSVPATELMKRVEELLRSDAQWQQIQQVLGTSDLLLTIRGPHLFAPRTGLNVIKHGCEIAIQKNPHADSWDALLEAKSSMERVSRFGD